MPEGHTIHRLARDHQKWFAGQKLIVSSPQGRFNEEAKKISGKQLREVTAHGKHLFLPLESKSDYAYSPGALWEISPAQESAA